MVSNVAQPIIIKDQNYPFNSYSFIDILFLIFFFFTRSLSIQDFVYVIKCHHVFKYNKWHEYIKTRIHKIQFLKIYSCTCNKFAHEH